MRGKIVNLCISFMNILLGILILIFTLYIPEEVTIQENYVVTYVKYSIYGIISVVALLDIIQSFNHRTDSSFNLGYILGIFVISFIFIKQPAIAIFSILSGIIVLIRTLTENLVELDSTFGISVSIVIMAVIAIVMLVTLNYSLLGDSIKNRENKNELAYKEDFFKYVQPLGITDAYINVKKDGKFGYINQNGEIVIDFSFDFASPFVLINEYDKTFEVALVSENGSSYIIMKNGRKVMSYRDESTSDNYNAKMKELERIYKDVLKQQGDMKFEINKIEKDFINKVPAYNDESQEYTYRYDYSNNYDLLVTISNLGLGDKYELAKKGNIKDRYEIDATNLDYDSEYLYLFSNGTIPFYEVSKRKQGWIVADNFKREEMSGKAQILDFYEDRMLLRNYNDYTIYFIDLQQNVISDKYKDMFICGNGKYIVKSQNGTYYVMNDNYENIFNNEYLSINPRLVSRDLYLILNSDEKIEANNYNFADLDWSLVNGEGNVIFEGIQQIYDLYLEIPNGNEATDTDKKTFFDNLKKLNYEFVGDKFYKDYIK